MRVRNVRSEPIDASLHLIIGQYDDEQGDSEGGEDSLRKVVFEKWATDMKDFVNWAIQFCFDFLIDNKHQQIVHSHYHLWVHFGNNFYNGVLNKVEVDWNCSPASPTFEMFHPADFKEMSKKILFHQTWFKFAALKEIV